MDEAYLGQPPTDEPAGLPHVGYTDPRAKLWPGVCVCLVIVLKIVARL